MDEPDLVAGVFCLMLMLTNLTSMGLVWDEPFYLEPKSWMNRWLGDVAKGLTGDGDRLSKALGEKRRREDWRCCEKHPSQYVHPPVATLASLLGWKAVGRDDRRPGWPSLGAGDHLRPRGHDSFSASLEPR